MTQTAQDHLADWLRDAHAMEQQAETMLEAQASRLEHYPLLRDRIRQHIAETQGQRQLLERCLEEMGKSPSVLKDTMGKMMAMAQAMGGMMATDEVVKGAMAGYVFEHLEIASYTALITAAERAGKPHIADVARQILAQEEDMAQWLSDHLPEVVNTFLARDAMGDDQAKR